MKENRLQFQDSSENDATAVFQQFVSLFESKGWLNQTLRVRYRDRRYRICCNAVEFFVYRINDHRGASHGHPGWPVCIVSPHQIIEDSNMSVFESTEPTAQGWFRCLAEGDFEPL